MIAQLEALSAVMKERRFSGPSLSRRRLIDIGGARDLLRKIERLENEALRHATPLPYIAEFHECRRKVRILDGSNQAAKSFHAALEVARAITASDPYKKYPAKNGLAIFVGKDGDHLANPMYRKLFKEGEFKLIQDEHSKKWRSVRPDPANPMRLDPYDEAHRERWKDAPPLVPPRMVRHVSFEDTGKEVPRIIDLTTGWKTLWRSSKGDPPQGVQADLVWIDEELIHSHLWINELIPRLMTKGGLFIWSATPQQGGVELYEYRQKADAGDTDFGRFSMLIDRNPYVSDRERELFKKLLTSEEEVRVRYYGEYAMCGRRVYPTYDPQGVHGCEPFEIPADWARFVFVDPARQHCGTLFAAVDPAEEHLWVYDGFDLQNSDAQQWAAEVRQRQHDRRFEAMVMDSRRGTQHHGIGRNQAEIYFDALVSVGAAPRVMGTMAGFMPGLPDVPAREEALLAMLAIRGFGPYSGTPHLQIFRGILPELDRQIAHAQTGLDGKRLKDRNHPQDLLDALEYGAAYNPHHAAPEPVSRIISRPEVSIYKNFLLKKRPRHSRYGVDL